jgi:hypothetical protein
LGWGSVVEALQDPVMVVAVSELDEGGPEFLEIAEAADPQELFFEGAKEALDASVSLGLSNESREAWMPRKRISLWKSSLMYTLPWS